MLLTSSALNCARLLSRSSTRSMAAACSLTLPSIPMSPTPMISGLSVGWIILVCVMEASPMLPSVLQAVKQRVQLLELSSAPSSSSSLPFYLSCYKYGVVSVE